MMTKKLKESSTRGKEGIQLEESDRLFRGFSFISILRCNWLVDNKSRHILILEWLNNFRRWQNDDRHDATVADDETGLVPDAVSSDTCSSTKANPGKRSEVFEAEDAGRSYVSGSCCRRSYPRCQRSSAGSGTASQSISRTGKARSVTETAKSEPVSGSRSTARFVSKEIQASSSFKIAIERSTGRSGSRPRPAPSIEEQVRRISLYFIFLENSSCRFQSWYYCPHPSLSIAKFF